MLIAAAEKYSLIGKDWFEKNICFKDKTWLYH